MRPLFPLLAGLLLGATSAWTLRHFSDAPPAVPAPVSDSASAATSPTIKNHPSLISNERLGAAEADTALDAYLALPPLPPDASLFDLHERSARLRALLGVLPTSAFARLFAAQSDRVGEPEGNLRLLAFTVWTERDAPAAARWALSIVPGEAISAPWRNRYVSRAVRAWTRTEFDTAYAWASALPEADLGRTVRGDVLAMLISTDSDRALALAHADGEEFFTHIQAQLFRAWADHDPAAALQTLGADLHASNRDPYQIEHAIARWAVNDPSAALAWFDAQPRTNPNAENALMSTVLHHLVYTRPDTPVDFQPLAEALATRALAGRGQGQIPSFLNAWARRDPVASLSWLDALPDAALRTDILQQLSHYGGPDALPFALKLPAGPDREAAYARILSRWADIDPDAAVAWLAEHDDPSLARAADRVQGTLLGTLAATDPAAALARWQNLEADEARRTAAPGIAQTWARSDPAAATRWLAEQLPDVPSLHDQSIYKKYSPTEIAEIGKRQQAHFASLLALDKTTAAWIAHDPADYLAWAESRPSPTLRQTALNALGSNSYDYAADIPDRSAHASLLATIRDPAERDRLLSEHVTQWLRSDPRTAREWIDSSDALSPETAAKILAPADAPPRP